MHALAEKVALKDVALALKVEREIASLASTIAQKDRDIARLKADAEALRKMVLELTPPSETPHCSTCEDGGWECYGLGFGDPHFRQCTACGNPNDHPSP